MAPSWSRRSLTVRGGVGVGVSREDAAQRQNALQHTDPVSAGAAPTSTKVVCSFKPGDEEGRGVWCLVDNSLRRGTHAGAIRGRTVPSLPQDLVHAVAERARHRGSSVVQLHGPAAGGGVASETSNTVALFSGVTPSLFPPRRCSGSAPVIAALLGIEKWFLANPLFALSQEFRWAVVVFVTVILLTLIHPVDNSLPVAHPFESKSGAPKCVVSSQKRDECR